VPTESTGFSAPDSECLKSRYVKAGAPWSNTSLAALVLLVVLARTVPGHRGIFLALI